MVSSADIEQIARALRGARHGIAFTGAGISTESGIPDYRSPGGVWATSRQIDYDEYLSDEASRIEYWRQKSIAHQGFEASAPNAGHRALAAWEEAGLLRGVITQNIDGLHQQAGNRQVLELHGTAREVACLECGKRWPAGPLVAAFEATNQVPRCDACHGITKHATISFGQSLDEEVLNAAFQWATKADVVLALGSSLVVHPAATLPELAQRSGAQLFIVNRDPTPLDGIAELVLHESIGEVLTAVQELLASR